MYERHWAGLISPSWEHERDLQLHRPHILRYWSVTPSQHRQTNRLYRQMRVGAAHRELAVPGRNLPRPRVEPRATHSLASPLQLFISTRWCVRSG